MKRALWPLLVLVVLASAITDAAPERRIRIFDLGFDAGLVNTNNRGDVVGGSMLWTRAKLIDLGALPGGGFVAAFAVNQRRQVVGWAASDDGGMRGFLWDNGFMTDVGVMGGNETTAFDINNRGQVAGLARTADGQLHAFVWERGAMQDLGPAIFVTGINNAGEVAGTGPRHLASIWTNGSLVEVEQLAGWRGSVANDINDDGQVVGQAWVDPFVRPFFWAGSTVVELPLLPGGTSAIAFKINNRGQIVGWGNTATGSWHAILWQDGVAIDLGTLVAGEDSLATGINDRGDIVGASGSRAVRWTIK